MRTKMLRLGAALALLTMTVPAVHAQTGAAAAAPADPDAIDYNALNNMYYTYSDLTLAKTRDFSDTTIAKLVKIAEESGTQFSVLSEALGGGTTFIAMANKYGVPLADLDHVQKQKDEVSNYISAYETSGQYAFPNPDH